MNIKKFNGFTLIELMIAVAIITILSTIALPNYRQYVVKSNRSAAQQFLLTLSNKQELYRLDNRSYATDLTSLGYSTLPSDIAGKYTISTTISGTPSGYIFTATPVSGSSQYGDSILSIDNTGKKSPADKWN
jgi:type IV pilus assembly protein PilE